MPVKPMLADNKPWNEVKVAEHLPVWGSIKLDGIRMLVDDGVGYSRSLKPLPNKDLQAKVKANAEVLQGFDGEIIIGDPAAEDCYSKTFTAVMGEGGTFDHRFIVFDKFDHPGDYFARHDAIQARLQNTPVEGFEVRHLYQHPLESMDAVYSFTQKNFDAGHEGSILRDPRTTYKHGRSTTNEGRLYKMKKWVDTEITITGFEELMHNDNDAYTNETGHTQRSSHKANKRPGNTLGKMLGTGFFEDGTPFVTKVGTFRGFTKPELKAIWDAQDKHLGRIFKIKYMAIGIKDAPRHPVGIGFRDPMDM